MGKHQERWKSKSLWYRFRITVMRHVRRVVNWPKNRYFDVKCWVQRIRRGWSQSDLWSYNFHVTRMTIAMVDELMENGYTYPADYASEPELRRTPNYGRGVEGYQADLLVIKEGFEHRLKAWDLEEKCTCCPASKWRDDPRGWESDLCKDDECDIIKEAWTIYTRLFVNLND